MRSTKSAQSIALALLTALMSAAAGNASAAVATGTLTVEALVVQTCVVAATPLVMGSYTGGDLAAPGVITVTCTAGSSAYQVGLGKGLNGATVASRKLKSTTSADILNYGLFSDSAHQNNWGETLNVDTMPSSAGTGALGVKTFTVYGKIAGTQSPPAGLYNDSVVITVTY